MKGELSTTITIVLKPETESLLRSLDAKLGRMLAAEAPNVPDVTDVTECATATDIPERMTCVAAREMLRGHIRALVEIGDSLLAVSDVCKGMPLADRWIAATDAAEKALSLAEREAL